MSEPLTSRDWLPKAAAGLVLGFVLALGVAGVARVLLGVGDSDGAIAGQFTMWLMAPVWAGILSFCFLFGSGARAWGWLGIAAVAVWAALFALGAIRP